MPIPSRRSKAAEKHDVHRAYIERARLYHPDRFVAMGAPPEVSDYLSAMARRINATYEAVKVRQEKKKPRSEPVFATGTDRINAAYEA